MQKNTQATITTTQTPPIKTCNALRILHSSDWHIGKRLHNEARYEDFAEFLAWLLATIQTAAVDVLVVAGDIFDTMTPSNKAQELYYHFLGQAIQHCRHIIISAGNHDSPSFLDAPKTLFRHFATHIVGHISDDIHDDVIVLNDSHGVPELIVACVPYLRDKDVRSSFFGESLADKQKNTTQGIAKHYADIGAACQTHQATIQSSHQKTVPIIATGHLFAAGSKTASDDDGMRDLYVGSLGAVSADSFGDFFDYVALGHIHKEQMVGGNPFIRYSGSPLAMGFGECYQDKYVLLVDFYPNNNTPAICRLNVPKFRHLEQVRGDLATIDSQLNKLINTHQHSPKAVWLDIEYTGIPMPSLGEHLEQKLHNTPLIALNIKNKNPKLVITPDKAQKQLQSFRPSDIFDKLLEQTNWNDEQKIALKHAHDTLLQELYEADKLAQ